MSTVNACYPVSPEGIRKAGVEEWLESYDSPVTSDLFQEIYDALLNRFIELLPDDERNPVSQTAICNYKLLFYLTHKCFFQIRLNKLCDSGFKSIYEDREISLEESTKRLSEDFFADVSEMDFGLDLVNYCRYNWRIIRTNWGHVNSLDALFPKRSKSKFYIVGGRNIKELKTYVDAHDDCPVTLQPRTFYPSSRHTAPESDIKALHAFIGAFLDFLKQTYPDASAFVNDHFRQLTLSYYTHTLNAIHQCSEKIGGWPQKPVLVTGIGNVHHRIFSVAWRARGGKVYNFTHGNSYCLAYKPGSITTGSHAIVDNYVASSKGEAELLKDAVKDFGNGLPAFSEVSVNPYNVYKPVYDSFKEMKPVESVRKVMVIGYPMSYHYHLYHPEHNSLPHLHLELSLIKALKKHGFSVVYKAHPDTLDAIQGIHDQYVDQIIPEPFEQVCHEGLADCVLFPSPSTTLFGYVLLTRMPVVVVDIKRTWWHRDVKPLAKKRCSFVNAETDGHGRIRFDEDELIQAVRESVSKMDMEIVEHYGLR